MSDEDWEELLPTVPAAVTVGQEALTHARMAAALPAAAAVPVDLPSPPTGPDAHRYWLVVVRDGEVPTLVGFADPADMARRLDQLRGAGDVYAVPFYGAVLQYSRDPLLLYLADGETALRVNGAVVARENVVDGSAPRPVDDYFIGDTVLVGPYHYRDPDGADRPRDPPPPDDRPPAEPKPPPEPKSPPPTKPPKRGRPK